MQINLKKEPKNPTIIHGSPGFGLVGSISTDFLINHLEMEEIGNIWLDDLPAMVAIHEGKLVQPLGIFYNEKYNVVVMHVVTVTKGNIEWKIADAVEQLAERLKSKEVLCIEGVKATEEKEETEVYYYTNNSEKQEGLKEKFKPLNEGVIVGVTSALLLKLSGEYPLTCMFAETHTNYPDSKAAAMVIKSLDQYLGFQVDYKPLLETAEMVEGKLKNLLSQTSEMAKETERKKLSYVG